MKIEYIKLINFNNIKTALKAKEISINFPKDENTIILIEGENGSGKTSLLSYLHPFALNGNLDIRNDIPLIVKGENGYKEIHIRNNEFLYIIKHHYSPSKDTHTVKSYISKNGTELNVNGNVSSFKEIVKQELDIEMDYLKLLRLGSNVLNFIDLKNTDRKQYMGKILDEVEIYLKFHKKVSLDLRKMKSIMSHIVDKLNKLGIQDIDSVRTRIKNLSNTRGKLTEELSHLISKDGILTHELSKLEDRETLHDNIKIISSKLKKLNKIKEKGNLMSLNNIDVEIERLQVKLNETKVAVEVSISKKQMMLDELNSLYKEKSYIEEKIKKEKTSENIKSSKNIISHLKKMVDEQEILFNGFLPIYKKSEVEECIVALKNAQSILNTTYEFGENPIKKAVKLLKKNEDVISYVDRKVEKLRNDKLSKSTEYVIDKILQKTQLGYTPCDNKDCILLHMWKQINDIIKPSNITDEEIYDEEFYTFVEYSYKNIKNAMSILSEKENLFDRMPEQMQKMLEMNTFFKNIEKLNMIYDVKVVNNILSTITEYEIYLKNKDELAKELIRFKELQNISNIQTFYENEKLINVKIEKYKKEIKDCTKVIENGNHLVDELGSMLKYLKETKELIKEQDELKERLNQYNMELESLNENTIQQIEIKKRIKENRFNIEKMTKEINDNIFKEKEYRELTKELAEMKGDYDDISYVMESLSSKKGIPLIFIEMYLKNTRKITNDLLEIPFGDKLKINKFEITESEFGIPYTKSGYKIPDVKYASQGEKSFISIALSFALLYQSLTKYNIMLLDEVDSTLDTENRSKFIQILERQSDMIHSEQIFLITHNNMFDMYPVYVINMHNEVNQNNKLAKYIKIEAK